jgi:hypothetical protein
VRACSTVHTLRSLIWTTTQLRHQSLSRHFPSSPAPGSGGGRWSDRHDGSRLTLHTAQHRRSRAARRGCGHLGVAWRGRRRVSVARENAMCRVVRRWPVHWALGVALRGGFSGQLWWLAGRFELVPRNWRQGDAYMGGRDTAAPVKGKPPGTCSCAPRSALVPTAANHSFTLGSLRPAFFDFLVMVITTPSFCGVFRRRRWMNRRHCSLTLPRSYEQTDRYQDARIYQVNPCSRAAWKQPKLEPARSPLTMLGWFLSSSRFKLRKKGTVGFSSRQYPVGLLIRKWNSVAQFVVQCVRGNTTPAPP